MPNENLPYIIYPSKKSLGKLLFFSLIFVVVGFFLLFTEGILYKIVGIISIAFFGMCFAFLASRLFNKKPALIVEKDYLYENTSYVSIGKIEWNEIQDMYVYEYMGQKFLGIETKDPDFATKRTQGWKKSLSRMNQNMVPAQINIPQTALSISCEELFLIMAPQVPHIASQLQENIEL
ncbi:STM3941 family protein [Risungbinella massiliensis]|uniref:STM3941 family protein n=1 Tax=Risungbinella massiliensis TaxID=1329796 RepID=UPI00069959AE|nr:STM3941 family protein [Risungbinella massiliensis]